MVAPRALFQYPTMWKCLQERGERIQDAEEQILNTGCRKVNKSRMQEYKVTKDTGCKDMLRSLVAP